MPRSGTTWLARLLAVAPGAALAGREPMNPRGRQYALGGTVDGWVRLRQPTGRQRRALWLAHRAATPMVYSRYGVRQWAAPLPWTRLVVKDPFALLSMPAIREVTGARPVLVYRHPGAMLASYRRMGWLPDIDELTPIVARYGQERDSSDPDIPARPAGAPPDGAAAMGWFWAALYAMAVADLRRVPDAIVVSHEQLASDPETSRELYRRLGLRWNAAAQAELSRETSAAPTALELHNLDRAPAEVATEWRGRLATHEVQEIESVTATMRDLLARLTLTPGPVGSTG